MGIKKPKNRISNDLYRQLFPIRLDKNKNIAFVMSSRLGDSLLAMIVVNNLVRQGYKVTIFGDHIFALRQWFPWANVFKSIIPEDAKNILNQYDLVLHEFAADVIANAESWHSNVRILEQSIHNWQEKPMVDIQADLCRYEFLLSNPIRENNIVPPIELSYRKNIERVIIHPTSSKAKKNWLPQRFSSLGKTLKQQGYKPEFIVAPSERKEWLWLIEQGHILPKFSSLSETAAWIYESGWFIGNDSGVGHLASNLGIPTMTLGMRHKMLRRWRPAWTSGSVLLPPRWLFIRPLKEKFWKYFITVRKIVKSLENLQTYISYSNFKIKYYCDRQSFTAQMQNYFQNPDDFFKKPLIKYFKNTPNETSTVGLVQIGKKKFVIKRYNVKNFWHRIKLWLRPSRAMTSWKNAHLLQQLNIPTLKPVAVIENRFGFLRGKAYFIYDYIDGIMCCDYFEKQDELTPLFMKALQSVAQSFKKMREHRLYHRDCHHSNMIILEEQVLLLDLDHMKKYRWSRQAFNKAHQKDITKFMEYLGNNITAKEFFQKCYETENDL